MLAATAIGTVVVSDVPAGHVRYVSTTEGLGGGVAIAVGFFTRESAATALAVFTLTLFALPDDPVLAQIGLFSLASALLINGWGPYAVDNRLENPRRDPDRS